MNELLVAEGGPCSFGLRAKAMPVRSHAFTLVELLIAYGAYKIKPFIQPKWFIWVNRISGIIFLLVGLKLALGQFI